MNSFSNMYVTITFYFLQNFNARIFIFCLGINTFLFYMFQLKAIAKDDFKSLQSNLGLDVIPFILVQPLEEYIEH